MTSPPSFPARKKPPWLMLGLLVLVFAGPMLAAWIAVRHEAFRPGGSAVHGSLVDPARPVSTAGLRRLDGSALEQDQLRGRWLMLYIGAAPCGEVCQRSLYNMRQTRLALGEDTHRVRRLLVVTDGTTRELPRDVLAAHRGLTVATAEPAALNDFLAQFHVTSGDAPAREQRLYVLDPLGNLVLFYAPDANPKGMLEDLERLLKASRIG